ncbi:MAG: hypothetical protein LBD18_05175 [Treponema sp.]|jgi:hypothetical protein|nr:hypothetical protein [Treponema sp.]
MKKTAAFLAIMVLFTGKVFSEFDFGFYGKGVFTPIAFSGNDSSVSAATATYANNSRPDVGFTMLGNNDSKTIGMVGDVNFNLSGTAGIGSNANIWVAPFDWIKLTLGKFEADEFRGQVGTSDFGSWMLPEGSKDEDAIFNRFKSDVGAHIIVKPLFWLDSEWADLIIAGAVGSSLGGERAFNNIMGWSAEDVYLAGQGAIGYRIPGIGFVRFQFIGNNREVYLEDYPSTGQNGKYRMMSGLSTNSDSDIIQTAFLYDGIENLKIDAGLKVPLAYTTSLPDYVYYHSNYTTPPYQTGSLAGNDNLEIQQPYLLSLGASYAWNNLNALLRTDLSFGGKYVHEGVRTITIGQGMGIAASVSYGFLQRFRAGLDLGFNYHQIDSIEVNGKTELIGERKNDQETSEHNDFGFMPWFSMNLGGGSIKTGVAVMMPSSPRYSYDPNHPARSDGWRQTHSGEPLISIPISLTYYF